MLVFASWRHAATLVTVGTVALGCLGCSSTNSTKTQSTSPSSAGSSVSTSPVQSSSAVGTVIEVKVSGGHVEGGVQRKTVKVGEPVVLRVTSDIADEVHVHGYDKKADVAVGGTVDVPFDADIPGVFEAELENAHLTLIELEIS